MISSSFAKHSCAAQTYYSSLQGRFILMLFFVPGDSKDLQAGARPHLWFTVMSHPASYVGDRKAANSLPMQRECIKLASTSLLLRCSHVCLSLAGWSHHLSVGIAMVRSSSWSHANRNGTVLLCFWVRIEAKVHPIGGYCNSCSFAHWPGINSPQGQGAVSGILIGTSGLIFTSLHILLHLLENEPGVAEQR